ncbi:MAG: efflux RND transporter periplasmic adaptor subunit [Parvibaculum sp.]|uniref:efflux RND transporter periplasmic adaptor subunit n=1 Tax=Parvibaculum sp. TaxID=2024848 RepID=UPI003C717A13
MITRRMVIMLIVAGVIFGGIIAFLIGRGIMIRHFIASMGQPPQTVSTTVVGMEEWDPTLKAVGTLKAEKGTDIAPQLAGIVAEIPFQSDSDVKAGDLLLRLADADDVANLNALKASAELSRLTYERNKELVRTRAVSQAALDTATANLKSAQAQVAAQQALVNKKQIRAPFDGHVGIRLVDLGQYLTPGQKVTTLQALDPIYVDFSLAQQNVRLAAVGQAVTITTDAYPGMTFAGKVVALDPKLDPQTRNVAVRAELSNPERKLLPGMFASVAIAVGDTEKRLTLPQTAITYNPYGETIFLIVKGQPDAEGKTPLTAQQKFVKTGETRGDQVAIVEGLKEGDTVVTSGQLKLKNGTPVLINNEVKLPNSPAPTPQDQ